MGDWHLSVQGTGAHHSGIPQDADQAFKRLVAELESAGHSIHDATFTAGARSLASDVQELKS